MKTMLLAAAAAFSLAGAAFAESEGGPTANTQFTSFGGVLAKAPAQAAAMAVAQNGQWMQVYATHSNQGTWLFAPQDGGGSNN